MSAKLKQWNLHIKLKSHSMVSNQKDFAIPIDDVSPKQLTGFFFSKEKNSEKVCITESPTAI